MLLWGYRVFEAQEQVASRHQLLGAGVTKGEIDAAVRGRRAIVLFPGVYGLAGAPPSPRGQLIAATLARPGAVVSHQSAGHLWEFLPGPPGVPTLTVPRGRRQAKDQRLIVHTARDLSPRVLSNWKGFLCTNPLRTMVDLAAMLSPSALDDAVDRGLSLGLVSPDALATEAGRTQRQGRAGPPGLLRSLAARGLIGAPKPSVLESKMQRLFARAGIVPLSAQVPTDEVVGRYRLDYLLVEGVVVEVEGYAYHSREADLRSDDDRFNELQIADLKVLRFTWYDVCHNSHKVLDVIRRALAAREGATARLQAAAPARSGA